MKTEELKNLETGTILYYRAQKVEFSDHLSEENVIVSIDGVKLPISEENIGFLFLPCQNIDNITRLFKEETNFFYNTIYTPINPEIKRKLISFWAKMCLLEDEVNSSAFVDTNYEFQNFINQLREVLKSISSTSIGNIPFFSSKKRDIDHIMELIEF